MWDLLLSESKYFLELDNNSLIGYFLLIGTILFLKSSFDASSGQSRSLCSLPHLTHVPLSKSLLN